MSGKDRTIRPSRRSVRGRPAALLLLPLLAASCGSDGDAPDVVTPPEVVATVAVAAPSTRIQPGQTLQLSATARSASGAVLTGKSFTWTSDREAVATVDGTGLVTGRADGDATITASTEGKGGGLALSVASPEVVRLLLSPLFSTLDVGQSGRLQAVALAAGGDTVLAPRLAWSSAAPAVATVDSTGRLSGLAPGRAVVAATAGGASDTAVVAVLAARSLLATALPQGVLRADLRPGATVAVPVVLDLSRVRSDGDLGAVQLDLGFDPAVLRYDSTRAGLSGAAESHPASAGRVRFAFAATSPQADARLTLATFFLTVREVPAGVGSPVSLEFTARPVDTRLEAYETPVVVGGSVRVTGSP